MERSTGRGIDLRNAIKTPTSDPKDQLGRMNEAEEDNVEPNTRIRQILDENPRMIHFYS